MKKLIYLFAATLSMVACNNEEISSLQEGKNLEVKFTSNLTGYDSQVVSRLSGTSFDQGDEVAIWALPVDESTPPFSGREVFKAGTDGKLSSDETFTYASDDSYIFFSAVYPASVCLEESKPEQIILNLETDESGYQSLPDFMIASASRWKDQPIPNFTFSRKCSKISVAVCNDGVDLSEAKLYVKAKKGGVFTWSDVIKVTTPEDAVSEDIRVPLVTVESFTYNELYGNTIVAPQILEGECIGIKLNDQTETKYVSFPKIELKEGYRYCFNINTRKNDAGDVEISIDSQVNETPWEVGEITSGEVEVDKLPVTQFGEELIVNGNFDTDNLSSFSCFNPVKIERIQESDGNWILKITNGEVYANDWGAQFFVSFSPVVSLGETYAYNFKIRSDAECSVGTQAQATPGKYIHWTMLGTNLNFKTEWTEIKGEVKITAEMVGAGTIAFNIGLTATNYYLDDFSFRKVINNE